LLDSYRRRALCPGRNLAHATFRLKHALVQSVGYESLLRSARQRLHARIATTLESIPGDRAGALASIGALAGDAGRAVSNWRKAGKQAIERCANREPIAQLTRDCACSSACARLGARSDRARPPAAPGQASWPTRGTAPETRPCYDRARDCATGSATPRGFSPVLYGQFSTLSRGEARRSARPRAADLAIDRGNRRRSPSIDGPQHARHEPVLAGDWQRRSPICGPHSRSISPIVCLTRSCRRP